MECTGEIETGAGQVPWDLPTIRFSGQYYDSETGLHYNRFRYYDPGVGRYVSADPLGQHADANLYAYVGNSPTNAIDPLGLYTWADAGSDAAFFARNSTQGLAAAADGAIPFFDPFAGAGAYDPCDPTLAGSKRAGAATAAALAALATYGAANGSVRSARQVLRMLSRRLLGLERQNRSERRHIIRKL